jgi:N-acyl-D-aspartate/D-glutamate deacylase
MNYLRIRGVPFDKLRVTGHAEPVEPCTEYTPWNGNHAQLFIALCIIAGGNVVDGTGRPAFPADIGIKDGNIVWVHHGGAFYKPAAAMMINAQGFIVTPGFIDSHCHSDVVVLRDPEFDAKIMQGVTTDVIGICGFSLAPVDQSTLSLFDHYLSAIAAGHTVGYEWNDFAEYIAAMKKSALPMNVVPLVGHGTVRMAVMGFDRRPPNAVELARMVAMVREAMRAGARGLSSGLIYPPGTYATQEELLALLEPVAETGGLYSTHIRNESYGVEEGIAEAIYTARQAGVPLVISHLKAMGRRNWEKVNGMLKKVDEAQNAGHKIVFDQYPYTACSTFMNALVPPWAHEGGIPQLLNRLKSTDGRAEIIHAIENVGDGTWENFAMDAGGWCHHDCGGGSLRFRLASDTGRHIGYSGKLHVWHHRQPRLDSYHY